MKTFLLSFICSLVILAATGQDRIPLNAAFENAPAQKPRYVQSGQNPISDVIYKSPSLISFPEALIGGTIYDLQSNGSTPFGRVLMFDDGTMGAVWTRGMSPTAYSDRGTGYNYYDGSSWSDEPFERIETVRTGWPSLAQLGSNGEVVLAHGASGGLVMSRRTPKGSGSWTQSTLPLPSGVNTTWWSRMVTGGTDKNTIHALVLTLPTANGGLVYQDQDGALLYYRSLDGGDNWNEQGIIIDGLGSAYYTNFTADTYTWVEPQGDHLAFIVSDTWSDLIVMESEDNGTTWQKTIVWEHPYPHWNGEVTDTIYCPDGSAHGAFDKNGKLHLVFGVNREMSDGSATSWFPFVDGVAYWNEDMPAWTGGDQLHCLDPDLLYQSGHLVGWMQDIDGNNSIDLVGNTVEAIAKYYLSPSSFPQIAFDQENNAVLIYSSITEGFDNGAQDYRHIWARASSDNGNSWGQFLDVTDDPVHMFDECVFPVISAGSAEDWYFLYQYDNEPGLAIRGDEDSPTDNYLSFYYLSKIINRINDPAIEKAAVTQPYPNPASTQAYIDVTLPHAGFVNVQVSSLSGVLISSTNHQDLTPGIHHLSIDTKQIPSGVYFIHLYYNDQVITKKLIIQH
ncbi:MAG: T9SS type A sorting domain-containing protein [Bacteroidales bacterium]|nr:T9SS type A sorting domain-containing protein [Bacteroidales bacterium]